MLVVMQFLLYYNKLHHHQCLASDANPKRNVQSLSDTSAGMTCRHCDCLSYCLTLSLSLHFLHRCMHILLSFTCTHIHTQTAVVSSLSAVVPCCRLAVTTPGLGLLFGRKACTGQILFKQIKKSMSSCLHQSTHSLSDGSTRYTTALLYLCLFPTLSHIHLFFWMHYLLCLSVSTLLILPLIFIFAAVSLLDYNLVLEAQELLSQGF